MLSYYVPLRSEFRVGGFMSYLRFIYAFLRIVVYNAYCVVFLLWFSSSYVASFSELSIFECPFRYSLTFIYLCLGLSRIYIFTLPYQQSLFVIRCFRIRLWQKAKAALGIQHTGLTLARYCDMLFYFVFQDLIKTKMNINSVMHMTNFAAQEIHILYSGWS